MDWVGLGRGRSLGFEPDHRVGWSRIRLDWIGVGGFIRLGRGEQAFGQLMFDFQVTAGGGPPLFSAPKGIGSLIPFLERLQRGESIFLPFLFLPLLLSRRLLLPLAFELFLLQPENPGLMFGPPEQGELLVEGA